MHEQKPWLRFYRTVPESIDYPRTTMYEAVVRSARQNPDAIAYDFLGSTSTYRQMVREVDHCANALASLGLRKSDRITISMPTSPQGIICFYAINKLGAVASMIHLLSPPTEIEFYLNKSRSEYALTLDAFYRNFREVADRTPLKILILKKISDYFPLVKKVAFHLTKGRKIPKVPDDPMIMLKDQSKEDSDMELELINYCRGHVIKRSCPREIEFRQELPKTLVGKIAFNVLEQEEIARLKSLGKYAGE